MPANPGLRGPVASVTMCSTTRGNLTSSFGTRWARDVWRGPRGRIGSMMCMLTQRELDFLASLKTGWRLLYRRELMRLVQGDAEAGEARTERRRPVIWRVVSG